MVASAARLRRTHELSSFDLRFKRDPPDPYAPVNTHRSHATTLREPDEFLKGDPPSPPSAAPHQSLTSKERQEMRSIKKKTAVVASGLALAVAVGAVAYAYWTNSGSGSGNAATGSNNAVTVNQTSPVADLYPGGPAATLSGNFDNGNSGKVFVHEVTASLFSVDGGSDASKPDCTTADFELTSNPALVDAEINSGSGVGAWSGIKVALKDTGLNQDNCKNAVLHISYSSN
jgi:hypothetical protein